MVNNSCNTVSVLRSWRPVFSPLYTYFDRCCGHYVIGWWCRKKMSVCVHQFAVRASRDECGNEPISAAWAPRTLKATTSMMMTTVFHCPRSRNATSSHQSVCIFAGVFNSCTAIGLFSSNVGGACSLILLYLLTYLLTSRVLMMNFSLHV